MMNTSRAAFDEFFSLALFSVCMDAVLVCIPNHLRRSDYNTAVPATTREASACSQDVEDSRAVCRWAKASRLADVHVCTTLDSLSRHCMTFGGPAMVLFQLPCIFLCGQAEIKLEHAPVEATARTASSTFLEALRNPMSKRQCSRHWPVPTGVRMLSSRQTGWCRV